MDALESIAAAVVSSFEVGLRKDKLYLNIVELGCGGSGQSSPVSQAVLARFAEGHKKTLIVKFQNQRRASGGRGNSRGGGRGRSGSGGGGGDSRGSGSVRGRARGSGRARGRGRSGGVRG
jgi:hypothetical protein